MRAIALIDCNNFFVSCERLREPQLAGKPVVVLSSNDGCVISRSNEAKALGIQMGEPVFMCEQIMRAHNVIKRSASFEFYEDVSHQVMSVLADVTPDIEQYSIDEAFMLLHYRGEIEELAERGQQIREHVLAKAGIPVSVGISTTKTLAKIAADFAKKPRHCASDVIASEAKQSPCVAQSLGILRSAQDDEGFAGVCVLGIETDNYLKQLAVTDVWGVGRSTAKFLLGYGLRTAYDLKQANAEWLRAERGINGWRLVEELRGHSVLPLDFSDAPNKSIMSSRSFGQKISRLEDLHAAIANFVSITARRLRAQELCVREITVMLKPHAWEAESVAASVKLEQATDYTATLIATARALTEQLYSPGTEYRKAGVLLTNLVANNDMQQSLFTQPELNEKQSRLMSALDSINNKFGRGTLEIASTQASQLWQPKRGHTASEAKQKTQDNDR